MWPKISLLLLHPFSLYFPWLSSKVIYASIDSHYCLVSHRKLSLVIPTHANNQNMVHLSHLGDALQLANILIALKGNKNAYILLWNGHKHFESEDFPFPLASKQWKKPCHPTYQVLGVFHLVGGRQSFCWTEAEKMTSWKLLGVIW